jgi:hypothetical protein
MQANRTIRGLGTLSSIACPIWPSMLDALTRLRLQPVEPTSKNSRIVANVLCTARIMPQSGRTLHQQGRAASEFGRLSDCGRVADIHVEYMDDRNRGCKNGVGDCNEGRSLRLRV